ncbi:acyl-CoA dehydrogenase family protein [Bordetella sp. BOR01]|uniref:acyl-CoA dehydrogenase family protein n=1 Tax=Bordetella sp. BOR01 TaxID=2854779 RepID=UPI001C472DD7|nr:acyl-CoA dehydrogenase family protein [Bordetella sp. BOR01]MBV7483329.1 acyl-CoA dehydrogenase family protein [Bordetella sp. BOR01]
MENLEKLMGRRELAQYLNPEQFEFRESVHRALTQHATPDYLRRHDEQKQFPTELVELIGKQGWFAVTLPEEYGGVGGYMDMIGMLEVMGYHSSTLARYWNINVNMVGGALVQLAPPTIKEQLLPLLSEGKTFFSFALSENGSGSDAASLKTAAVRDGDDFVVNGTKMWITGAVQANHVLLACRTDKGEGKHEGISLLLVPNPTPGMEVRPIDLLGGHMVRSCEINFIDARVPATQLIGDLHSGWKQLMGVLGKERIALSAIVVGAAQSALDLALGYAKERKQFGRSIASFQTINHRLVELQTQIDCARLLAYRGASLLAAGQPCNVESAQAKFFAGDTYMKVALEGLQIMGANGYSMEYAMQRHFREAKVFQILGGTGEILRNIVARELLS